MNFIIDYSKWRCGGNGENKLGEGETYMLNQEGFMCCLGQCQSQLGIPDGVLSKKGEPEEIGRVDGIFNCKVYYDDDDELICNTVLSDNAISINDDDYTTPFEKMNGLKELFEANKHEISFINTPEIAK